MTPADVAIRLVADGLIDSATASVIERTAARDALRPNSEAEVRAFVAATLDTITEIGSLDPPIRDILRRSGLSRQVFYHYFDSKDDLLLATLAAGWRIVATYVDQRVAAAESPQAKLQAWIAGVMRQAQSSDVSRLTKPFAFTGHRLEPRYPAEYADARRSLVGSLARIIDDGVAAGAFTTDEAHRDALAIYDAVFARQNRYIVLGELATRDDVEALARFALRALGERPT